MDHIITVSTGEARWLGPYLKTALTHMGKLRSGRPELPVLDPTT
jgi:hypothetical protein